MNKLKKKIKKILNWQITLAISLIGLSSFIYYIHYLVFHDAHHIFIYMVGDIAFVPMEVLLVTVIIHRVLSNREKKIMLKKMNMVIGAFFSEVGTELISTFAKYDPNRDKIQDDLMLNDKWTEAKFLKSKICVLAHDYGVDIQKDDLKELREFLLEKRDFLLRLLENPNLLEHDDFTDLLWAAFHLTEELQHRKKVLKCTHKDLDHLRGDIKRVYCLLIKEWLEYVRHLKADYPYLYSLAIRTNPFNPEAKAEVS